MSFMANSHIPGGQFNHFDYVDALENLSELELVHHPRKRRLAEEFAAKCLEKLEEEENAVHNKAKVDNFLNRMKVLEDIRQ